ncbi:MAG: HU family DNA-binding protein [Proteobacteria bacterium]|jgi:DNA-binding protein HU-beta|nr:HU family DNA-binding protein [Pseudomonadota bacterium]
MTKTEIVAKVAEELKISKVAAGKAFQTIIGCIEGALKKGGKTTIIGFGTFSVAQRSARKGRNPRTGKEIKIAAKKVPKFSAGAALKAVVNGKAAAKPVKKAVKKPAAKAKKK